MAQQVSTEAAHRFAERVLATCGPLTASAKLARLDAKRLRSIGLSQTRANCCVAIAGRADEIRAAARRGGTQCEQLLLSFKGVGPWTVSMYRIAVLREPDVLPSNDVGLVRAVRQYYGSDADVASLAERWRPFRSVACWYLWRTLGSAPLV